MVIPQGGSFSHAGASKGSRVDFLYDLFILSKILVERAEFTEMVGSLELADT